MNLLFCHDGPLHKDESGNYYGIALNNEAFERYYLLANHLKIAIRVKFLSNSEDFKTLSQLTHKPLDVIECPNLASLKHFFYNQKKAKKILSQAINDADIIVIRLPSLIGFKVAKLARKMKKKYMIEAVACPFDAYWNSNLLGKALAPIIYLLMRKELKKAKHTIYVTRHFLQNRYPTKGVSINCSNVVINHIDEEVLVKRINKISLKKPSENIVIGTIGAVDVVHKGQINVIKMLAKCQKKGINNLQYQMIGGGNQTRLKLLAKKYGLQDKIFFLGRLKSSEIFTWLDAIDIYAQPSFQEGLPRSVIEAMSRALPVIGARTGGIPELINNQYIFPKRFRRTLNMCRIMNVFQNKKILTEQSKRNFLEAKSYHIDILNNRREKFYLQFKQDNNL